MPEGLSPAPPKATVLIVTAPRLPFRLDIGSWSGSREAGFALWDPRDPKLAGVVISSTLQCYASGPSIWRLSNAIYNIKKKYHWPLRCRVFFLFGFNRLVVLYGGRLYNNNNGHLMGCLLVAHLSDTNLHCLHEWMRLFLPLWKLRWPTSMWGNISNVPIQSDSMIIK